MRYLLAILLVSIPALAHGQDKKLKFEPITIKKIHVGFHTYKEEFEQSAFKVGLWAPIYVEVHGGSDGVKAKPGYHEPYLEITTNDSEDVGTTIRIERVNVEPQKSDTFLGYVKTGHVANAGGSEINVTLHVNGYKVTPQPYTPSFNMNIDAFLYLTLGPRLEDYPRAVKNIGKQAQGKKVEDPNAIIVEDMRFGNQHNAVYENDVKRLPDQWFGYNGVDLMILGTGKREFLTELNNKPEKLKAIAQWVRRGGRLVVPVSPHTQDAVHASLTNPASWHPPIPVVPPKDAGNLRLDQLTAVETWGGVQVQPFQQLDKNKRDPVPIQVATLDPGRVAPGDWDVWAPLDSKDGPPLIANLRYGLGQITYLAFGLQDESFANWKGREQFLTTMTTRLAPKAIAIQRDDLNDWRFRGNMPGQGAEDPSSQLLANLDKFGVTVIDFGYVALFIILYILIVGPLDFFLLKYVFKRLEWTWITFPAVVLAVSVIAYFAAYALKGKDLKINKVDVVDIDLRTNKEHPRIYGNSFFMILSPRIQNYTVGLEPNPEFWGASADKPKAVDVLSWMGRPSGGFGGMDRGGSGGFFRKPYEYAEDEAGEIRGVRGVPIPVWTTKAFMASWEQPLEKAPLKADLVYSQNVNQQVKIAGTLENHLGVDLVDTWLIYEDHFHPIRAGLARGAGGKLDIDAGGIKRIDEWVGANLNNDDVPGDAAANVQQTQLMKRILFFERWDTQRTARNHLLRPIDLGWRVKEEPARGGQRDRRVREAILFGRVRPPVGAAESLTTSATSPLPTQIWLGDIPDEKKSRPTLSGQLNQDTYIRVLLPVRPAEE